MVLDARASHACTKPDVVYFVYSSLVSCLLTLSTEAPSDLVA